MKKSKLLALDALAAGEKLDTPLMKKLNERYSVAELREIAGGERRSDARMESRRVYFDGQRCKLLAISDTHIGSLWDTPKWVYQAFEVGRKEGCEFYVHAGDVSDGMGMDKKGYVYDLRLVGAKAQEAEAVKILGEWKRPAYIIGGNHDAWYYKENGYNIVENICSKIGATYLGSGEGRFSLKGKAIVELFHGEDAGSAYAYTYRVQRLASAVVGGEKPNLLFTGHDHKSFQVFPRNIHCIGLGALSMQSRWMRQKRMEHHSGFWVVDLTISKRGGIADCGGKWYPFYA